MAAVSAALALLSSACTHHITLSNRKAPRIVGYLRASGTALFDGAGHRVQLSSVALHDLVPGSGNSSGASSPPNGCRGYSEPSQLELGDVASWGFNSVRLAISWADLEPTSPTRLADGSLQHRWNMPYVQALDRTIQGIREHGIAVILDMHQWHWSPAFRAITSNSGTVCEGQGMPTWLYPDAPSLSSRQAKCNFFADHPEPGVVVPSLWQAFADAWTFLAARYANDDTVVGADMINEPYIPQDLCSAQSQQLDRFYTQVGGAIRSANPSIALIFEDTADQGNGVFAVRSPPPFPNVIYSWHEYTSEWIPEGRARVDTFEARAARWHVPGWIGEFNRFGKPDAPPLDWPLQLAQFLSYCRKLGIGWTYWALTGADGLIGGRAGTPNLELVAAVQTGW